MQEKLTYMIVDDCELDRLFIEAEAARFSFLAKVASCSHALEASEIISTTLPDIIFTDIEMPDIDGLALIRNFTGKIAAPVFITSHAEFAVTGFELEAFDYILKPLKPERFEKCILRLQDFFNMRRKAGQLESADKDFIIIKQSYERYRIAVNEILYLEAMKDYTRIVTGNETYLTLGTLTGMLQKLSYGAFKQIHRSFIVNADKINAVKLNTILIGEHEIPVGKFYKNTLAGIL